MRFVVVRRQSAPEGVDAETHVEMEMLALARSRRDGVDVEIEDPRVDRQLLDPAFFDGFAQGHPREVGVAVAMAAELEPAAELAMVGEQHPPGAFLDHQRRAGQMTFEAAAPVGVVGVAGDEIEESPAQLELLGIGWIVAFKQPAGHGEIGGGGEGVVGEPEQRHDGRMVLRPCYDRLIMDFKGMGLALAFSLSSAIAFAQPSSQSTATPLLGVALGQLQRLQGIDPAQPRENLWRYFATYPLPADAAEAQRVLGTADRILRGFTLRLYAAAEDKTRARGATSIELEDVIAGIDALLPGAPSGFKSWVFFPRATRVDQVELEIFDLEAFRDTPFPWAAIAGVAATEIAPGGHLPMAADAAPVFAEAVNTAGLLLFRLAGHFAAAEHAASLTSPHLRQAEKAIGERARTAAAPAAVETPPAGTRFIDVTDAAGLSFRHVSSDWISRFRRWGPPAPTFSGGGVSAEDLDGDGRADLVFCGGEGCGVWRARGDGTFEDVTRASGLGVPGEARMAVIADLDDDGDRDVFLTYARDTNRLFENLGGGKFRDVTQSSGLEREGDMSGPAVAFDYDNDGRLDLYVGNFGDYLNGASPWIGPDAKNGQPNRLYRNLGGLRFEDTTERAGVGDTGWVQALSHADLDGDGDQDLFLANDFGTDELYENQGDGTFRARAEEAGADDRFHGMNVAFADLNRDALADIAISNIWGWVPTEEKPIETNTLLISQPRAGGGIGYRPGFDVIPEFLSHDTGWAWAALFFDAENDGDDDLFLTNGLHEYSTFIQYRRHPTRRDQLYPINNSREKNLFFENQDGVLRLPEAPSGAELGDFNSRGLALLDYDCDGDLDLAISTFHARARIFRNDAALKENRWLVVELVGDPAQGTSRDAIGARLTARGPDGLYVWRTVSGGEGYLGMSTLEVELGLGAAETVDLTVDWPGKKRQELRGVTANQRIRIWQGGEGYERLP